MSEQGEKKQTGKGILVISIIAIVVVAVLIGIIIFLLRSQNKSAETTEKRQVVVTEDNVEAMVEDLVELEESDDLGPSNFTVTMFFEWHFKDGNEASYDSYVENVADNTADAYFDIVMAEDESQVLYSSPIIPIGGKLDKIKLNRDLDAGTYNTVCIYNLVDENHEPYDKQVRVALTLVVEE